jgi:hypothetical protein
MRSSTQVVLAANARRNARATADRAARWGRVRAELWDVLDPIVPAGARVAVAGAGNADDLPLTRLASRASGVHLVDLDVTAPRRAIARERRSLRARLTAIEQDVTAGAAERVAAAVIADAGVRDAAVPREPIGTGGYDVVVGDLLYTQLLFPALLDAEVDPERRTPALRRHGQRLTDGVVARLHASAAGGHVVHVNDVAGWWPGHPQPLTPEQVMAPDPGPAALLHHLGMPAGCDVPGSVRATGDVVASQRWWTWPFADDTTYLVHAIVARAAR